jgi:transcriptional regulator with XRE-family HTH domain
MSQEELARRAGVGRRTVINAEAGTRRTIPSVMQALAGVLDLDLSQLHLARGIGKEAPARVTKTGDAGTTADCTCGRFIIDEED